MTFEKSAGTSLPYEFSTRSRMDPGESHALAHDREQTRRRPRDVFIPSQAPGRDDGGGDDES
jgi:hypothetical protein